MSLYKVSKKKLWTDFSNKFCGRISIKFFGEVGHGTMNNLLDFGGDADHDPEARISGSGSGSSVEVCAL